MKQKLEKDKAAAEDIASELEKQVEHQDAPVDARGGQDANIVPANSDEAAHPVDPTTRAQDLLKQQWALDDREIEDLNQKKNESKGLSIDEEDVQHAAEHYTTQRIKEQCGQWIKGKLYDMAFKVSLSSNTSKHTNLLAVYT